MNASTKLLVSLRLNRHLAGAVATLLALTLGQSASAQVFTQVTNTKFAPGVSLATGTDHGGLLSADLNNDGLLDLVIVNNTFVSPTVLRNKGYSSTLGNQEFGEEVGALPADNSFYPNGLLVGADYDNDGDIDIFATDTATGTGAWLWRNDYILNGSPSSSRQFDFTVVTADVDLDVVGPSTALGVVVADFDADNDLDVIYDNPGGVKKYLLNQLDKGTALFVDAGSTKLNDTYNNGLDLAGVDVNLDGYLDLMSRNSSSLSSINFDVMYFNTAGNFSDEYTKLVSISSQTSTYVQSSDGYGMAWGDYDNNGIWDVVLQNRNITTSGLQYKTRFFYGSYSPSSSQPYAFSDKNAASEIGVELPSYTLNDAGGSVMFGDIDNDGDLDLYYGSPETTTSDRVYRNVGATVTGKPSQLLDITTTESALGTPTRGDTEGISLFDWDNDGDLDLFVNQGGSSGAADAAFENRTVISTSTAKNFLRVRVTCHKRDCIGATVMLFKGGDSNGDGIPEAYAPGYPNAPLGYGAISNSVVSGSLIGMRQVSGGTGLGAQESFVLHFGLPSTLGPSAFYTLRVLFPGKDLYNNKVPRVLLRDVQPSSASGTFGSQTLSQFVVVDYSDPAEDGDGLPRSLETTLGTDYQDLDSDDDGLMDWNEQQVAVTSYGESVYTNPAKADTDGDGIWDGQELAVTTGLPDMDGVGVLKGTNTTVLRVDTDPTTKTNPFRDDTDKDGIKDGAEDKNLNGQYDGGLTGTAQETDPLDLDTDDDGLFDGAEVNGYTWTGGTPNKTYYSEPRMVDSDSDGLNDGLEVGLTKPQDNGSVASGLKGTNTAAGFFKADADGGVKSTDPKKADTDADGLSDGLEDRTKDGEWDSAESETDPTQFSSDAGCDGDGAEQSGGTNPLDPLDDSCSDPDADGCDNATETAMGTNKYDSDSDDDGIGDCVERNTSTNPKSTDTDADGVPDGIEDADKDGTVDTGETDPRKSDTDGDGLKDGIEDTNKNGKVDAGESNPLRVDSDDDGRLDGNEDKNLNGVWESYILSGKYGETKAAVPDTDNDGLPDGLEIGLTVAESTTTNTSAGYFIVDLDPTSTTDPNVADTDGDRLSDGDEDKNKNGRVDSTETNPNKLDTDGDGCDDGREVLTLKTDATKTDTDGDGLGDCEELGYNTDPLDADSDNDGLSDGNEVLVTSTNPVDSDSDNDKLLDGEEVNTYETDPRNPDSDADTLLDGDEVLHPSEATDPNDPDTDGDGVGDRVEVQTTCLTSATDPDSDDDGLSDGEEDFSNQNCVVDRQFGETDPLDDDSDEDGLLDGYEKNTSQTQPLKLDSDEDGVQDGTELGFASPQGRNTNLSIFQPDLDTTTVTDPLLKDSDGDGLVDGGVDANRDGKLSRSEGEDRNFNGRQDAASPDLETDATDKDTDGDQLKDGEELSTYNTDPLDADTDDGCEWDGSEVKGGRNPVDDPTDDSCADADNDGISNDAELTIFHTNPFDADTDDDGLLDGEEPGLIDLSGDGFPDAWDDNENGVYEEGEEGDVDGDGLNPALDPDSDNDGVLDGTERGLRTQDINPFNNPDETGTLPTLVARGFFIPDSDATTKTNPLLADSDGGGADDGAEDPNHNGARDSGELNPLVGTDDPTKKISPQGICEADTAAQDTDCDGLTDAEEDYVNRNIKAIWLDKADADSDDDGVLDGDEANWTIDTDGDLLINARDVDSDNDGLLDGTERGIAAPDVDTDLTRGVFIPDADPTTLTSMVAVDTDFGGADDGAEDPNHDGAQESDGSELNPLDGSDDPPRSGTTGNCEVGTLVQDTDCDGLTDAEEQSEGVNFVDADSDDDGVMDGLEHNWTVDTDDDGSKDVLDCDSDGDLVLDGTEVGVTIHVKLGSIDYTDERANCYKADDDPKTVTAMISADTDGGLVDDGVEDANLNGKVDGTAPDSETNPLDPTDDCEDNDVDALCNRDEEFYGTDPNDADTDDDGVIDSQEGSRQSPWYEDYDADGLINALDPDSDNDGVRDGTEQGITRPDADTDTRKGFYVADADPTLITNPCDADSDDDGVDDGAEDPNHNGNNCDDFKVAGNPACSDAVSSFPDTDVDGLTDAEENHEGSDPQDADSDDDGVLDGAEDNWSCDMDQDGTIDALDIDSDADAVLDGTERGLTEDSIVIDTPERKATNRSAGVFVEDQAPDTKTYMVVGDTDKDGFSEGDEDCNRNGATDCFESDPLDDTSPAVGTTRSVCTDTDSDSLTDVAEDQLGSDPLKADSDGDGINDLVEAGGDTCNPLAFDVDQDGLISAVDQDSDGDGLDDCAEAFHTDDACEAGYDPGGASPIDTDGDGAADYLDTDSDNDDLSDEQEVEIYETDPYLTDTDGGGRTDGEEALQDLTSPLYAADDNTELRGGSCSYTSGSSRPDGSSLPLWLGLILAPLAYMGKARRRGACSAASRRGESRPSQMMLALLLLFSGSAEAADNATNRFNAQSFRPALDLGNYFSLWDADVLRQWHFNAALGYNFAYQPLVQRDVTTGSVSQPLVQSLMTSEFYGGMGLTSFISVHLSVPISYGNGLVPINYAGLDLPKTYEPYDTVALGDAWIAAKFMLLDPRKSALGVALIPEVSIPLGTRDLFFTESIPTFRGKAAVESNLGLVQVVANMGYHVRPRIQLLDILLEDTLEYGLGLKMPIIDTLDISSELVGSMVARNFKNVEFTGNTEITRDGTSPLEFLVGAHYRADFGLIASVGGGLGLNDDATAPRFRGFAFVGYRSPLNLDEDGDGIPDRFDKCPKVPENFNGVLDEDGCPEPDTDGDGIVDPVDACPTAAEDVDNFQDDDGCPDLDNDGDGIPDEKDQCPNDPEDKDGFEDADGCPDADNDRDGLGDNRDRCPNQAEDFDGFEDEDGCPEVDNDGDGILDSLDKCPNEPEDKDAFEDDDGCPDEDNDKDGIKDLADKCPNEPEVINGVEDEDGCPDEGTQLVFIKDDKLVILFPVHFEYNKVTIRADSETLLNQVAMTIKANDFIKKIRIEGHTDWDGDDNFNLKLSQGRAESVRDYLIKQGVDANRLEAQGFGETRPIASNKTNAGKEKNRRVEFIIVEREEKIKLRRRNTEEPAPLTPAPGVEP
ncbi:MAG: OmpA family protein [Myxococcota bacterium]